LSDDILGTNSINEIAPNALANGTHMPRVKRPKRGPPTMPNTESAA